MLEHLIRELPEDRRPPLEEELALLGSAVKRGFRDEEDRKRAGSRITRGSAGRIRDGWAGTSDVDEFLEGVSKLAVLVFVVTCMATAGLGLSVRDIVAPLRRGRLVLLARGGELRRRPGARLRADQVFPSTGPTRSACSCSAARPGRRSCRSWPKLARGDIAFSVGLMLLLMVGSVAFMPVVLPLLIPGLSAGPWPLLRPLLFTMLLPLAAGMVVRSRSGAVGGAATVRASGPASNVSMIAAVVLLFGLNFAAMLGTFGSGAVAVGVVFVSLSRLPSATPSSEPSGAPGRCSALGTGQRNVAAALLDRDAELTGRARVVVMLLVTTFAGLAILLLAARGFRPPITHAIIRRR